MKIHFVNTYKGNYLKNYSKRTCNFYHTYRGENLSDNILPICTRNCDLFELKKNQGVWNEKLNIFFEKEMILDKNFLMLFEVLDFNLELVYKGHPNLNNDNLYRICWGYLRPVGLTAVQQNYLEIELFRYKFRNGGFDN